MRRTRSVQLALTGALALLSTLVLAGSLAGPATAANLFTLDPSAESMGPVAVDASGNGYVAWLHKGTPDTVMFCKLPPDAHSCPAPITLSIGGASPNTPFPVLGPGGDVYVVAPSYDTDEMIMWQSSNGGASFGAPWIAGAPPGGEYEYVCQVETDLDDVLAFNAYGGQYDPSQGLTTLGGSASNIEFEMSSANPDINWTFAFSTSPSAGAAVRSRASAGSAAPPGNARCPTPATRSRPTKTTTATRRACASTTTAPPPVRAL
jgi:hypothetical protein